MATFKVLKRAENPASGAVYLEGHLVEMVFSDLAAMSTKMLEDFDKIFEPVGDVAKAVAEGTVPSILSKRGES